jgi:hypothetical protein
MPGQPRSSCKNCGRLVLWFDPTCKGCGLDMWHGVMPADIDPDCRCVLCRKQRSAGE